MNNLDRFKQKPPHLTNLDRIGVFLFCSMLMFFMWYPLTDADIFWHLASGREMLRTHSFLHVDPFSFTPRDPVWINIHWLFQVLVYGLFKWGGYGAILCAKCCGMGIGAFFLCRISKQKGDAFITGLLLVASLFVIRYEIDARPIVITLACIALFMFCLTRFRSTRFVRYLVVLPFVMVIWVNCQGLYVLGIAILGFYMLEDLGKNIVSKKGISNSVPLILALLGVLAACWINPNGLDGVLYAHRIFARIDPSLKNIFSENVSENMPLLKLWGTDPFRVMVVLVFAGAYGVMGFFARKKSGWAEHAIVISFFILALMASRNTALFFWVAAPSSAVACGSLVRNNSSVRQGVVTWSGVWVVVIGTVLVLFLVLHFMMLSMLPKGRCVAPFRFPEKAIEYMKIHDYSGNVFNTDRYGGYLLWQMYPPVKDFIDGRFILRSPAFFAEYLNILDSPQVFEAVAKKFSLGAVLIQTAYFPRYLPLARNVYHSKEWKLVYTDGASCLFYKVSSSNVQAIQLESSMTVDSLAVAAATSWPEASPLRAEAIRHIYNLANYLTKP